MRVSFLFLLGVFTAEAGQNIVIVPATQREERHDGVEVDTSIQAEGFAHDWHTADKVFDSWSNMQVCLDGMRYSQATLTEGVAVMGSFADKFAGRVEGLLDAGAPLHFSFLWNAHMLQVVIYRVIWTITTLTASPYFQQLSKAVDVMAQYAAFNHFARSTSLGETGLPRIFNKSKTTWETLTKEDDNEDRKGLIKTQPFSVQDAAKSMLKGAHPLAAGAAWLNAGWLKDPPTPPQVAAKYAAMYAAKFAAAAKDAKPTIEARLEKAAPRPPAERALRAAHRASAAHHTKRGRAKALARALKEGADVAPTAMLQLSTEPRSYARASNLKATFEPATAAVETSETYPQTYPQTSPPKPLSNRSSAASDRRPVAAVAFESDHAQVPPVLPSPVPFPSMMPSTPVDLKAYATKVQDVSTQLEELREHLGWAYDGFAGIMTYKSGIYDQRWCVGRALRDLIDFAPDTVPRWFIDWFMILYGTQRAVWQMLASAMLSKLTGLQQGYGLFRVTMSYLTLFWQAHATSAGSKLGAAGAGVWKWLSPADFARGLPG